MKTLKTLFLEELADRYDGERQLVRSMPEMANAATCSELKKLITLHLRQTEEHVTKLESVFQAFNEKPHNRKCQATVGLLKESDEIASYFKGTPAINAALISSAQKMEHYEIASYGCLHEWAKVLNNDKAAIILQSILDEEGEANRSLKHLARSRSNLEANQEDKNNSFCNSQSATDGTSAAI